MITVFMKTFLFRHKYNTIGNACTFFLKSTAAGNLFVNKQLNKQPKRVREKQRSQKKATNFLLDFNTILFLYQCLYASNSIYNVIITAINVTMNIT